MYSSPAATPRPASPQLDPGPMSQSSQVHGRLMQVKVLYTFDDDSKTNCLARCPQPVTIQTARLDHNTEIGVIELRTCIQAIVSASPELVAKLGKDYTVYAYDYSEYETPLVGQGMLSWVLATASTTPTAPAQSSRTLVTGRVCRNVLGLFSGGSKEILEVKLRLIPVPTCLQSEYLEKLEKYRDSEATPPENFDPTKWADFLRENPNFGATTPGTPLPEPELQHQDTNQQFEQGLAEYSYESQHVPFEEPTNGFSQASSHSSQRQRTMSRTNSFNHAPVSRSNTPSLQQNAQALSQSRPSSRASNSGTLKRQASSSSTTVDTQPGQISTVEQTDEGQNRKRARLMKADWRGPSTLANTSESLRVTASAAASIRGHRLSTTSGIASEFEHTDASLRPPTPRPHGFSARNRASLMRSTTSLAEEIVTQKSSVASPAYTSPAYTADIDESAVTSPEGYYQDSLGSTPAEFPSSPPIMHRPSPVPSSPPMPEMANHADSGYVPGSMDNFSEEVSGAQKSKRSYKRRANSAYATEHPALPSEMSITEEMPGDPNLLPQTFLLRPEVAEKIKNKDSSQPPTEPSPPPAPAQTKRAPKRRTSKVQNRQDSPAVESDPPAPPAKVPIPRLSQSSVGQTSLPPTGLPTGLPQTNSFTSYTGQYSSSRPASPIPGNTKSGKEKPSTGSGIKRKRAIQERLASSIMEGVMPPFCQNCGEIQTPTWRKAFVKVENGTGEDFQAPENDDGYVMWEPLTRDEDSKVTTYRIVRKSITNEDREYEELQLCNSCGLWLFKCKSMRPPEYWNKAQAKEQAAAKRRLTNNKKHKDQAMDAESATDGVDPPTKTEHPSNVFFDQDGTDPRWQIENAQEKGGEKPKANQTATIPEKPRANSISAPEASSGKGKLIGKAAVAALEKAFQSSPPRFPGSKHRPIDVEEDVSPQKTRRLLFPSPRKPGEVKSLDDGPEAEEKTKRARHAAESPTNAKENVAPMNGANATDHEDPFLEKALASPRTPRSSSKSNVTPTADSKRKGYLSSAAKRWKSVLDTPVRGGEDQSLPMPAEQMTPFTAQLAQLISDANHSPHGANNLFSDALTSDPAFFNFSDWGTEGFATDAVMPTSSPTMLPLGDDPTTNGQWIEEQMLDMSSFDAFGAENMILNNDSHGNDDGATA